MFNTPQFITAWDEWKTHLKEKTFQSYTPTAERKAISALFQRCHGQEQLAIDSINYSIEKNWTAVYRKPTDNGQQSNSNSNPTPNHIKGGTSADRVETARNWGGKPVSGSN